MTFAPLIRAACLGLACITLAACSNRAGGDVNALTVAQGVFKSLFERGGASAPAPDEVARQAAGALASTTGRVIVVAIPERDVLTVMQEIERNGPYITFGTADRRSITLKGGMVTATRGLGNDLMSADVDAVTALIRRGETDATRRVNRYLDGENRTISLAPWCQVKPAGPGAVALGEVQARTTRMLESCLADTGSADTASFQNSYQVDGAGRIVQSRQWISPLNGYIVIQSLR
ncbi:hypothetical protein D6850_18250 [Roseovarius spongiae]|uniref:YjbF family lipoprotein n=1 Tax=Roseovarius spongiae TaxID=2320272 RepID=A0A3A8AQ72_9RHOB|nr:YjbF family lipoprotein [Roseovarius spongiae]RKF12412.1 hypothetical protein D6850_18250 [Roseovarius spongiae]